MKKFILIFLAFAVPYSSVLAQPDIYPAPVNKGYIIIKNATIHVGNGTVINNGSILIQNGKIEKVGSTFEIPADATVFDVKGKQVYPGLISPLTNLGLKEVAGSVRGTNDFEEIGGDITPSVRSIVAYNTDSKVINVLRTNGILLANVIPQDEEGSSKLLTGTSTVVQLDAWNWEDAAYKMDGQMHLNMPSMMLQRRRFFFNPNAEQGNPAKAALEKIDKIKSYFREAKGYLAEKIHKETNLNFEALKSLFDRKEKLFIHCNGVKEMLLAIDFAKEFNFDVVIAGGADSWQIAPLLKQNNIAVILKEMHSLPATNDDDVDQPYKTPYLLQKAGVLFCIADNNGETRGRNLMYNAGTAAAYGLTKEEALSAITLNTAKILGIENITGSIEAGKDANIVVCEGDILDMEHSIVDLAFIQGRNINLQNHQTQLADRYEIKYGIKASK
ncbi:MAG: amidohydrolase family protein [Bacteroidetes bacterium]|nr:amidohydrolase family protein [Bacteroidota bacterium]